MKSLDALFHEKAVFVHMGATMTKTQELEYVPRTDNLSEMDGHSDLISADLLLLALIVEPTISRDSLFSSNGLL